MKRKQFLKGIYQLAAGGRHPDLPAHRTSGREELMAGVVGVLQMDVLEHRLKTRVRRDHVAWNVCPSAMCAGW